VHEFDRDRDGHRGLARRAADLARRQRGERPEPLARRKDRVVDRASQRPGAGSRRRQGALERLLERGAMLRRETIEGEGGGGAGGGPLQG